MKKRKDVIAKIEKDFESLSRDEQMLVEAFIAQLRAEKAAVNKSA